MLQTFAVSHYRSLRDLKLHLQPLTVVTGANGCGKSNLYRALRLLQRAAEGTLAQALAMEGGIESVCWAGPENPSSLASRGFTTQGGPRRSPLRVAFGFASDDYAYEISLGRRASSNPVLGGSFFGSDPEVKSEYLWEKPPRRKANTWLAREGDRVSLREQDGSWTARCASPGWVCKPTYSRVTAATSRRRCRPSLRSVMWTPSTLPSTMHCPVLRLRSGVPKACGWRSDCKLTPRPPELLVLNEPEQSLHPDLLRPLARQIVSASKRMQVWIISHAPQLTAAVEDLSGAAALELVREDGETRVRGQRLVDEPVWP